MNEMFRPLEADEIEVRVKQIGAKGATALLYKTARTDMDLLDETVGADSWSCEYSEIHGNLFCGISIKGVTKWDCGIESRSDDDGNEKKGEASDAFKRAGFRWGIGRELYTSPFIFLFAKTEKDTKTGKYKLSGYPTFSVSEIGYDDKRRISSLSIINRETGEVVYSYPKFKKRNDEESKDQEPPEQDREEKNESNYADAEAENLRKIIIGMAAKAGRDEKRAIMFAEELVETATKTFVKWADMDVGLLTKVKVELAKRIS